MDRDRYSGNCLFKVEAGNGEEEQKTILCGEGGGVYPTQLPLWDTLRDDEPPALLSLACMFGEALKTNEKESYMTKKIEISDIGILDTLPRLRKVLKAFLKKSSNPNYIEPILLCS